MEEIKLITDRNPKSPVAEAYRNIRTNIQFFNGDNKSMVLMGTSATPNEGKSTTFSNLGVVMAQAGHRVLVIDADLRNPTQHKIFGLENKGTSNVVAMNANETELICASNVENLYVLPAGPIPPNPSELLGSEHMTQLLERCKANFDYVIVDTPPVMPVTDAAVLASRTDGVLLVVASGAVSPAVAVEAKTRLEQAGAHILGVILNKVDIEHDAHHYGYYYYYGDDHKGGANVTG